MNRVRKGAGYFTKAAKLPGAGISLKQCPGKCAAEKGHLSDSARIG